MNWKTYKTEFLKDKAVREEYDRLEPEYQIARAVVRARIKRGFTQSDLAKRVKTKQSVISRLENANSTSSVSFLQRIAKALDTEIPVLIKP